MRTIGIDVGTYSCGYAAVDTERGRMDLVECGVFKMKREQSLGVRLIELERDAVETVTRLFDGHDRVVASMEGAFVMRSSQDEVSKLAGWGVIMLVLTKVLGVPPLIFAPSTVKKAVTGSGRADKQRVAGAVQRLLGLSAPPEPHDAADACAVAIAAAGRRI